MIKDNLPEKLTERLRDGHIAIFLFHGVIKKQSHAVRNYTGKHIESELFARCIQRLKSVGTSLTMDQVLYYHQSNDVIPKNAFAITFDDGFENNLSIAAPILFAENVSATIYITTSFVENNCMSWIDLIEHAVEETSLDKYRSNWSEMIYDLSTTEGRIDFLKEVRRYVKGSSVCSPIQFADLLCTELGIENVPESLDLLDKKLTWDQIKSMNSNDLISFGGHSHTHPILSYLSENELRREVSISLDLLKSKGHVGPTHYSYPEGQEYCFSDQVISVLKEHGVECCPTAIDGVNTTSIDPFHLKRILVA